VFRHPTGELLDALLGPGQFVVVEPDGSELVCADRAQMIAAVNRWGGESEAYRVRWKCADGSIRTCRGPLPDAWGLEG
jgi:hypothetical protein